ncbi:MAG: inositol monophosphatase [Patescibacteria group bacterium]
MMIDILQTAAKEAGDRLLTYFQKEFTLSEKTSHQNLVTQADLESQNVLKAAITKLMVKKGCNSNDLGFVGEEKLETRGKHMFIIDPLDGTANFASGYEHFSISIGYVLNGMLMAGLVYHPPSGTYFYAQKDKGAFKRHANHIKRLHIKHCLIKDSLVVSYLSTDKYARSLILPSLLRLSAASRGLRIFGACSLDMAYFSENANNINIVLHAHPSIWDIAGVKLIITESGGVMTNLEGLTLNLDYDTVQKPYYGVLVCHPENLREIISLIKK